MNVNASSLAILAIGITVAVASKMLKRRAMRTYGTGGVIYESNDVVCINGAWTSLSRVRSAYEAEMAKRR